MRFELTTFTLATKPGSDANSLLAQAFNETKKPARSTDHSSRKLRPEDLEFRLDAPVDDPTLLAAALVWSQIPSTSREIVGAIVAQAIQGKPRAGD